MASQDSVTAPGFESVTPHFDSPAPRFEPEVRRRLDQATVAGISLAAGDWLPAFDATKPLSYEWMKRGCDVVVAAVCLLLLSPVFLATALLLKLCDSGPVFFYQTRVGRGGMEFTCYKFRTMVINAEQLKKSLLDRNHHQDGVTFKIPGDPRMTRFGAFLRKASIDELPQLVNVLKGDMSIVGPRPPVPEEVTWYSPRHLRRLEVRPGLTCSWQVSGRGDVPFEEQVRLDVQYIENRSLWLDSKLMLLTIPAVLSGRGAY